MSAEDKTESHFNIVEHITTKSSIGLKDSLNPELLENEDLRIIAYKTLLEKFNKKYSKLNLPQKNLLREFINNVSNTNSLKETIKEKIKGVKKDIKAHSSKLQDDVVKIK